MDETQARQLLGDERRRLVTIREGIESADTVTGAEDQDAGESAAGQHPADVGTETETLSRDLGLLEQIGTELADIEDALRRLEQGTYGRCEACGRPIADERLEANPTARYDAEHQPPADVAPPL